MPPLADSGTDIAGIADTADSAGHAAQSAAVTPPPPTPVSEPQPKAPEPAPEGDAPTPDPGAVSAPGANAPAPSSSTPQNADFASSLAAVQNNPFFPVDWKGLIASDPATAHGAQGLVASTLGAWLGSSAAKLGAAAQAAEIGTLAPEAARNVQNVWGAALDGHAISQSVQNIWHQDDAMSRIGQALTTGLVQSNPATALASSLDQSLGGKSQGQAQADVLGGVLPMTANPVNALGAGGGATGLIAGAILPSLGQALASVKPEERDSALAWAAITGAILGAGHLGAARDMVQQGIARWPEMEGFIRATLAVKNDAARQTVDPFASRSQDVISQALARDPIPASRVTLADNPLQSIPNGEKLLESRPAELRKVLDAVGVDNVDELLQKAGNGQIVGAAAKIVADHWTSLGLPYNLEAVIEGEDPLRDPRSPLREIHNAGDEVAKSKANSFLSAVHAYLDQTQRGDIGHGTNPMASWWRSMIGLNRGTDAIDKLTWSRARSLLANKGITGSQLSRAVEGDQEIYKALPPEGRMVVDGYRLISNSMMHAAKAADHRDQFVPNYLPRMNRIIPTGARAGKGGQTALSSEPMKSRTQALVLDDQGKLIAQQAFGTVHDANTAIRAQQKAYIAALTDPLKPLSSDLATDPNAVRVKQLAMSGDPAAKTEAAAQAALRFPEKETDFLKIMETGVMGRQLKAIHSSSAIQELLDQQVKAANPAGGQPLIAKAAYRVSDDSRQNDAMRQMGYRQIPNGPAHFQNLWVHPELADLLDRSISRVKQGNALTPLLDIERKAVQSIMYSPMIHGANMAGRVTTFALTHPLLFADYLKNGGALKPSMDDIQSTMMRLEAWDHGVLPYQHGNPAGENLRAMGNALGDTDLHAPLNGTDLQNATEKEKAMAGLAPIGAAPKGNLLARANNYMWSYINDFGTAAYHIEKEAAMRAGVPEQDAALWAARRANTWMGHVAPEDANPGMHDVLRTVAFAPNWWRTWAELLVPAYKRAGYEMTPELARYMAGQQAKLMMSLLAVQKGVGNGMNMLMTTDHHTQAQNQPGAQDRIEITNPNVIRALQAIHYTGADKLTGTDAHGNAIDPATNARMILENPLARQTFDTEQLAGLQSGQPDYKFPDDIYDGGLRFLAARLSPLASGTAAAANVDLYQSAANRQWRHVNPNHDAPDLTNLGYALLAMTPASGFGQQLARDQSASPTAKNNQPTPGPFGTQIPKWASDLGGSAMGAVISGLTGGNPPHNYAAKTRGTPPTDEDYQKLQQIQGTYQTNMATLSAQAMGGALTPNQWLTQYRDLSTKHANDMEVLFKHSPSYAKGTDALVNQYESLNQQAEDNGVLNFDKLTVLQQQFRQSHTDAENKAIDAALGANEQKYPMLKVYRDTIRSYQSWQQDWAAKNGVDVGALRAEVAQYGALYGNQRASQQYLVNHRDLALYERAKQREWETSPNGLVWGLFYNSPVVTRYLQAHRETPQQAIQQAGG